MHFVLGVLSGEPNEVNDLLAPFQENNMGDCPMEYMEFWDVEEEYSEQYKNESSKRVIMPDGRFLSEYDREFDIVLPHEIPFSEYDYDYLKLGENEKVIKKIPEGLEIKDILLKIIYSTFEDFLSNCCGFSKNEETGKYGYWYNPDSKWDWYELGGRWRGLLLVQENKYHQIGSPGVFGDDLENRDVPKGYKWVDHAKIKDIEWDLMREIEEKNAAKYWDDIQEKRKNNETIECIFCDVKGNKEDYIKERSYFHLYAALTYYGEWHDKDSFEDIEKTWEESYFDNFINNVSSELYLSIIDCHI